MGQEIQVMSSYQNKYSRLNHLVHAIINHYDYYDDGYNNKINAHKPDLQ